MILTGKAKEDFKIWFDTNYSDFWYQYHKYDTLINALIIEWFDSVGVYIKIDFSYIMGNKFKSSVVADNIYSKNWVITRQQATEQAIIKANEIYNETKV